METLVGCAILGLILTVMLSMVSQTAGVWRSANSRIEAFQGARRAFDVLTTHVSQATLNTYWGYDNDNSPTRFLRKSELQFIVAPAGRNGFPGTIPCGQGIFFQAPAGKAKDETYEKLPGLLNFCGFYVEYGSDAGWLPGAPINAPARDRYRLMFWLANTDVSDDGTPKVIYREKDDPLDDADWIAPLASDTYPLADNIIALVIWPREESGSATLNSYSYNSRSGHAESPQAVTANQLPPILEIAMVAIDEISATRLGGQLPAAVDACLNGLFDGDPAATFSADLKELESRLSARGLTHRVFSSAIPLREAKWSPL